ncbi:MAG: hypothetical protein K0R92_385 [Lachnospiraceae bacterium]|jgi:hypothetical protein|nr:hypothetical protein [Lachnospiraceae bacterium]
MPLVLKTKKRQRADEAGRMAIKVSAKTYNRILEVSEETGESMKDIAGRMIEYAYENIAYESEDD